ncbi:MAG: helix-turn-helix domain-containing protein [Polyangiaceae bacterium]
MANHSEQRRPPLTVPGAAKYAGTSERHVRRLILERRLASCRLGGRVLVFPDDIDALLEAGRRPAIP